MNVVPYLLVALGFVGFLVGVIYELLHHHRNGGPTYEGRKHIVFPWVIASWFVFGAGFAMLATERN